MNPASSSPFFVPDSNGAAATATAGPATLAARRSAPVEELRARIRRYNEGLDPNGETFRAALILVAACEYGQNVDLLARRTGLPRPLVARCARRLIDNGIWVGGKTVAEWAPEDPASGNFWNDAAVAEGKMCRRTRPDGSLEWAPPGFWNKNFHFLDPDADNRLGTLYFDSSPPVAATPEIAEEDEADEPATIAAESADPVVEDMHDDALDLILEPANVVPDGTAAPEPGHELAAETTDSVPPLHHVFRDAVWIG